MSPSVPTAYAFNRTRRAYLATELCVASTHWARLRGLMGASPQRFFTGKGLWIVPSHGVHTLAMRFPIDVLYLDRGKVVVHLERSLKPWRVAPVRARAASVLELPQNTLEATGTSIGDEIEIAVGSVAEVTTQ